MLRRRSKMVAEYSQHMLGKAMDFYLPDVPIDRIREVGLQMQRGGVGWYPHAGTPFVHLDVGSVRMWPRMTHDQLARLFPDGKTVLLASDNRPFPRYEEAKAEILARGGTVAGHHDPDGRRRGRGRPRPVRLPGEPLRRRSAQRREPAPAPPQPSPGEEIPRAPPSSRWRAPIRRTRWATRAALAYAAPAADDALRGSLSDRARRATGPPATDAQALLTAVGRLSRARTPCAAVAAPLPPRRPSDLAAVTAALTMPLPPPRPVQLAALDGGMANLPAVVESHAVLRASGARARHGRALCRRSGRGRQGAVARPVRCGGGGSGGGPREPERAGARRRHAGPRRCTRTPSWPPRPDRVATRFSARSPGDDLTAARFTGSATRAVAGRALNSGIAVFRAERVGQAGPIRHGAIAAVSRRAFSAAASDRSTARAATRVAA